MKPNRRNRSARITTAGDSLAVFAEALAQLTGVADPRKLKPGELVRLINSTPLGQVLTDRILRKQRDRAGHRISDGRTIDLFRYAAWLADAHRQAQRAASADAAESGGKVPHLTGYEAHKERARQRQADIATSGRELGELPPIADPVRRAKALENLEVFCTTYFPLRFKKRMSKDQRLSLKDAERIAKQGGKKATAAPRGDGKTTRCEVTVIWAILRGLRRFVPLIGATSAAADENLQSIKGEFETNDLLAADFPEVCHPIRALEGIHNRCKGQTYQGQPTRMKWSGTMIVLPTIQGSPASGAVICCRGILGRVRGMKYRRPDGETIRPDLVIVDDPQTELSAKSPHQCQRRLKILTGAILGLAGPGESIACFVPCTVIEKGDLADQILDRDSDEFAAFQGTRTKLIHTFPTNEKLWDEYAELRRAGLRNEDLSASIGFYKKHRKAMDAGAVVAWEERYDREAGELSAIQHAMNLRIDHPDTFDAEYQNQPRDPTSDDDKRPTAAEFQRKLSGLPRLIVHLASTLLTAFIDVQQRVLYWGSAAWSPAFSGGLIDYGTWPDQGRNYFLYRDAAKTIQQRFPTAEVTGAIRGALDALVAELVAKEYKREDWAALRIGKILIDSGDWSDVVYQACRESPYAGMLLPSKGIGIGPTKARISEWKRAAGRVIGEEWQLGAVENKRAVRLLTYDTNYWKWRLDQGLATPAGDRGCITLFGQSARPPDHSMLAAHCTAEQREKVTANERGRSLYVYSLPPAKPDNHLYDVFVGNAVCASLLGCRLIGPPAIVKPGPPRRPARVAPLKC